MASAGIPIAVVRALRQMSTHPSVISLQVTEAGPTSFAVLQLDTRLPSRWLAEGRSPNGVRATEPVTVRFDPSFPATAPRFFLRPDFDRSHPHIQPRPASQPPEPCLAAVSTDEVQRAQGVHGLLDQLALWLERAARVELIEPKQGWEPTRRDHIDDIIVADAGWLAKLPKRDAETRVFEATFSDFGAGSAKAYGIVALTTATPLRATLMQDLAAQPRRTFCMVAWSGKLPSGEPLVAGQYEPETVSDIAALHARAHRLGCGPQLASSLQLLESRLRAGRFSKPIPLAILVMARRPCPVIGQDTVWELLPYMIELSGGDDLGRDSTKPVRIAMQRQPIGSALLRRAAGDPRTDASKPWTLLGCGSVGSKLALHLARAGRAPAHIVDKAWMAPHNYARHGLLPMGPHEGVVLLPKSFLLAEAIGALGQVAAAHDVNLLNAWQQLPAAAVSQETAFLINATGSLAVREALAAADHTARARIAESCLFAEGRVAYLSLEGPRSNPSTADLAAEAYRLVLGDERLTDAVLATQPTEIAIGQGCAALTSPMPDARLSAMTAAMAGRITSWHADGLPADGGHILIGTLHDDGMSQNWQHHDAPPWTIIRSKSSPITVRVAPHANAKIAQAVAARPSVETGGVLIGRWSDITETFHVVDVLTAPADSSFSRDLFVLGTQGLPAVISDIVRRSHGALYPLGTWDNHLANSGPSRLDRHTAQALARQQQLPVLLLIHTPGGYRFLTAESVRLPGAKATPATLAFESVAP